MSYRETIDWLYSLQTLGIKLGLENMQRLIAVLGLEKNHATVFHVAGTNGKGSTCAMIDSICRASGRRSGFFSSPHLVQYRERIRVDGVMISEADVIRLAGDIRKLAQEWGAHPTFFEVTLGMALLYFRENEVDAIVLETGMGGRLDATNAVASDVCVVTPIGLDHQQWLGSTLGEIAGEKAGIFKKGVPVVSAPQDAEAAVVLIAKAAAAGAPLTFATEAWEKSPVALTGAHQKWNAACAVAAIRASRIGDGQIERGLLETHWPGRFQRITLSAETEIVLDGAHNEAGLHVLIAAWRAEFGNAPVPVVVGIAESKNTAAMLAMLCPLASELILARFESPRASDPHALKRALPANAPSARVCESVPAMLELLRTESPPRALIAGSLFLIGETLGLLDAENFEASAQ